MTVTKERGNKRSKAEESHAAPQIRRVFKERPKQASMPANKCARAPLFPFSFTNRLHPPSAARPHRLLFVIVAFSGGSTGGGVHGSAHVAAVGGVSRVEGRWVGEAEQEIELVVDEFHEGNVEVQKGAHDAEIDRVVADLRKGGRRTKEKGER